MSKIQFEGTGPGAQTKDGCSVEFYRLLKPQDEPELISSLVPKNSSILELGCGVGRVTHPLIEMGFSVTAVDNSKEMLTYVKEAKTVCADIESLKLMEKFDAVLLMSHMINFPNDLTRQKLLKTCKSHLKPSGVVIIQCHPKDLSEKLRLGFVGRTDKVDTFIDGLEIDDTVIEMTIRWVIEDKVWTQSFETEILNQSEIETTLQSSGLQFSRWLNNSETIFAASHI